MLDSLCEYGCGKEAKHKLKNGKWCCNNCITQCPAIREKNRISKIGKKRKEFSEEHKQNISNSKKGNKRPPFSDETRLKMSLQRKGISLSNEHKRNISISLKGLYVGEKNPMYGKNHSNETKERIRERKINFKHSQEFKNKQRQLHLQEKSSLWKGGYYSSGYPMYDTYFKQLDWIEKCKRNEKDKNILEVQCTYCGRWFIPTITQVYERIRNLNNLSGSESRFYCSNSCKIECPIYGTHKYPKDFIKSLPSREVQSELRQLRFQIDNYTCQKCGKHQDELDTGLHCHHIEGIRWEPLESADIDKVITLCKYCHKQVHKKSNCSYTDMQCRKEK